MTFTRWAWLKHRNQIYFAQGPDPQGNSVADSPLVRLIQGIYGSFPDRARTLLRERIFTNSEPSEMCLGMLRVAAKRWSQSEEDPRLNPKAGDLWFNLAGDPARSAEKASAGRRFRSVEDARDYVREAQAALEIPEHLPRHARDRRIVALLLSADLELLVQARHRGSLNRTHHAEVALLQSWEGDLPPGMILVSGLKPCKMCAGMLWHRSRDPKSIRVYYDEFDPGPSARSTILDPHSVERARVAKHGEGCPLEWALESEI